MLNRRIVSVRIEIRIQIISTLRQIMQELPHGALPLREILHSSVELRSVAGRQNHKPAHPVVVA